MIFRGNIEILSNVTMLSTGEYVYLNEVNVVDGVVFASSYSLNITSVSPVFDSASKIYSNGGCEILKETGES